MKEKETEIMREGERSVGAVTSRTAATNESHSLNGHVFAPITGSDAGAWRCECGAVMFMGIGIKAGCDCLLCTPCPFAKAEGRD